MSNEGTAIAPAEQGPAAPVAASPPLPFPTPAAKPRRRRHRRRHVVTFLAAVPITYVGMSYLLVPMLWATFAPRHPSLEGLPRITETGKHIEGDPLNVALIGTKEQVVEIMQAAHWLPADGVSVKSSMDIAVATLLRHPYPKAPVSPLYLFGRKQDLAFQKPVGGDPRQRDHVRFWQTDKIDEDNRPVWIGSATFDDRVGLTMTAQVTHHIAADVDTERDRLLGDLEKTNNLSEIYVESGFHTIREGFNGGRHPWHTDGDLRVGVIAPSD